MQAGTDRQHFAVRFPPTVWARTISTSRFASRRPCGRGPAALRGSLPADRVRSKTHSSLAANFGGCTVLTDPKNRPTLSSGQTYTCPWLTAPKPHTMQGSTTCDCVFLTWSLQSHVRRTGADSLENAFCPSPSTRDGAGWMQFHSLPQTPAPSARDRAGWMQFHSLPQTPCHCGTRAPRLPTELACGHTFALSPAYDLLSLHPNSCSRYWLGY